MPNKNANSFIQESNSGGHIHFSGQQPLYYENSYPFYWLFNQTHRIKGDTKHLCGAYDKFPDFFRMGTFIDSTHMKL